MDIIEIEPTEYGTFIMKDGECGCLWPEWVVPSLEGYPVFAIIENCKGEDDEPFQVTNPNCPDNCPSCTFEISSDIERNIDIYCNGVYENSLTSEIKDCRRKMADCEDLYEVIKYCEVDPCTTIEILFWDEELEDLNGYEDCLCNNDNCDNGPSNGSLCDNFIFDENAGFGGVLDFEVTVDHDLSVSIRPTTFENSVVEVFVAPSF